MPKGMQVLCIVDDPSDREALGDYGQILSMEVTLATSSNRAIAQTRSRSFDVILTEHQLSDCTGLDLVEAIRTVDSPNRDTPVILISHFFSPAVIEQARVLSVDALVTKPLLLSAFKGQVRRLACERVC